MEEIKDCKFTCPCCGYNTLNEKPPGTYDICSICFWEDDGIQFDDPDYVGGANYVSLREAQLNFKKFGACEERVMKFVRKPNERDVYQGSKDISKIRRVPIEDMIAVFKILDIPMEKVLELYKSNKLRGLSVVFNSDELEKYISLEDSVNYSELARGRNEITVVDISNQSLETIELTNKQAREKLQSLKDKFIEEVRKWRF